MDDTAAIVAALAARYPTIQGPRKSDICYATQNRQTAVKELARRAEFVFVIGSPNSSNANRLVEVARNAGAAARLIESCDDVESEWLDGVRTVGLSAGSPNRYGVVPRGDGVSPSRSPCLFGPIAHAHPAAAILIKTSQNLQFTFI